ncbi:MAG: hypothetical protein AAGK21_01515 [Bacteroidota bacterium]
MTYEKAAGDRYVSRDPVLDELLCVGWIDGARRLFRTAWTPRWRAPADSGPPGDPRHCPLAMPRPPVSPPAGPTRRSRS